MKHLSLLFLLFLSFTIMKAQEPKTFTLKQAQEYAIKNNPTIRNARLDIEMAKKKIWETTAMGLPQINAAIAYTYMPTIPEISFKTPILINPVGAPGYGPEMIRMEYMEIPIKLGVASNMTVDFTVSQLVFNGSYIVGLQTSKIYKELSEQSLIKSETDIKESIANTYQMVLVVRENKLILDQMTANMTATLKEIEALNKEGFVASTDVDQIRLTLHNLKNALNTIEQQLKIAHNLLKFQIGLDINEEIILTESLLQFTESLNIESLISQEFDITQNINYRLLNSQQQMQKMGLRLEQSAFMPSVFAFYNRQEKAQRADFDFSFPDMFGVNVSVPIFSSGQRLARVSQAKIALQKTENMKRQASEGIMLDVMQSRVSLNSSYDKYLSEKMNVELAERIYKKTLIKYKEGLAGSMELTQASTQWLTAQSNLFNAAYEVLSHKNKIEKLFNRN